MNLLRSKRSCSELKDQKDVSTTSCDEQLCVQESSQARQMDRSKSRREASKSETRAGPPDGHREK